MRAQRNWKLMVATGLALTGLMATATGASAPPPADPPRIAGVEAPTQATDLLDDLYNAVSGHSGDHDSNGGHDGCDTTLINTLGDASSPGTPFSVNFFGGRSQLFVNNDGTVTFDSAQGAFPGTDLTALTTPTIAPFLANAAAGSYSPQRTGKVSYGPAWGGRAFCVRWDDMTPAGGGSAKNTFSLLLRKTNDTGDFDIEFRYEHIGWDGGPPNTSAASVGLTAGTGLPNTVFVLPGSRTAGAFVDGGPKQLRNTQPTIQSGSFLFHVIGGIPTPIGAAPTAPMSTGSGAEDAASIPFTLTSTDADGDQVTFSGVQGRRQHGTVNCSPSTTTGTIPKTTTALCSYVPDSNFNGTDTFDYRASDNHGNTTIGHVTITVTPVNDPPTVDTPQALSAKPGVATTINLATAAHDVDGNTLTFSTVAPNPTHGTATCTTAGVCTYTGTAGNYTPDVFTVQVSDGTATSTITVNVTLVNAKPVASFTTSVPSQPVTTSAGNYPGQNLTVVFNPTVSDPDGPSNTLQCRWVFGDGTTEPATANTFGPCAVTQHTYSQPGTYTVALTVTDGTDSTTVMRKLEVGRDDHGPGDHGPGDHGPGDHGPGDHGPGDHGPGDHGPGDHGPGDHGPGDHGPGYYGGHHDRLELVNDTGSGFTLRGTLRHGDFRIERSGGEIRRITGTGWFEDGSSVSFHLRVRHHRAFGTITVRDHGHLIGRFDVHDVRISAHGDTVEAHARYPHGGGRFYFLIEDRG